MTELVRAKIKPFDYDPGISKQYEYAEILAEIDDTPETFILCTRNRCREITI